MTVAAKVSVTEITEQVASRFVDQYYECVAIYSPGVPFIPGVTDEALFLSNEVPIGTAGYDRQVISYKVADVGIYADDGVSLATKATVFSHDGGVDSLEFSHVALIKGSGNVLTVGATSSSPTAGVDGTYTNLPTSSSGGGSGLTIDLTIISGGTLPSHYIATVNRPGYGYAPSDVIAVSEADLVSAGAVTAGAGALGLPVSTVTTGDNSLFTVAEPSATVVLTSGNEAVFYWNVKQYNFATA
jgi:hypothetical protein